MWATSCQSPACCHCGLSGGRRAGPGPGDSGWSSLLPGHFLLSDRPGLTQEMGTGRFSAQQGPLPVILWAQGVRSVQHILLYVTGTSIRCFA